MIKHLFKLIWNRKRLNYLLILEIFFSFIVLFSVVIMAVFYLNNYSKPLGFEYNNVWAVRMSYPFLEDNSNFDSNKAVFKQLESRLGELDEIEAVCGTDMLPFDNSEFSSYVDDASSGKKFLVQREVTRDGIENVLNIKLVSGRWYGKVDDGASYTPVVINRKTAKGVFGNVDPIGKNIWNPKNSAIPGNEKADYREYKVVGIIDDYRKKGELSELTGVVIERKILDNPKKLKHLHIPGNFLIKMKPGTTAAFEEKLIKLLQSEAKDWSFEIKPLTLMREEMLKNTLLPLYLFAVVAFFLLVMVALGLTGVLWLNVTQRTNEMGLRRACGAARTKVYKQILGELFVITTIALTAGILLVAQFPLLNLLGFADAKVYTISILISALLIYALTTICGLYPGRMATNIHPADALHYE